MSRVSLPSIAEVDSKGDIIDIIQSCDSREEAYEALEFFEALDAQGLQKKDRSLRGRYVILLPDSRPTGPRITALEILTLTDREADPDLKMSLMALAEIYREKGR